MSTPAVASNFKLLLSAGRWQRFALLLLAVFGGVTLSGCTHMVFQPLKAHVADPRHHGVLLEDRSFATEDGVMLHGWWLPARAPGGGAASVASRGTVIFLHGNAENISTHIGNVLWMPEAGFNVYLYDYRGYGRSEGVPDFDAARRDLILAIDRVRAFAEVGGQPLYVFGQSLGGAIALSALGGHPARTRLAGVVVEGAPASLRQISREVLGQFWLTWPVQYPLSFLISDDRSPREQIAAMAPTPLFLAYSRDDRVVPLDHGLVLRAVAPADTVWHEARGPHISAFRNAESRRVLLDFFDRTRGAVARTPRRRDKRAVSAKGGR